MMSIEMLGALAAFGGFVAGIILGSKVTYQSMVEDVADLLVCLRARGVPEDVLREAVRRSDEFTLVDDD